MGDNPARALRAARDTRVLEHVIPEVARMLGFEQESRYHSLTVDEHTFLAIETAAHVGAPLAVRLALLFHDAGKPEAAWRGKDGRLHYYSTTIEGWGDEFDRITEDHEVISERLWRAWAERSAVPRQLLEDVARLIRHHMVGVEGKFKPVKVRRMRVQFGDEFLHDLLLHRACDASGKGSGGNRAHLERIALMEEARVKAQEAGVPAARTDLQINGHDLLKLGLKGKDIGLVQDAVLDEVVCDPSSLKLTREWQLDRAIQLRGDLTPSWV
jgi:tRNA nucleotidyltransferase (CCA-adding enzyme)